MTRQTGFCSDNFRFLTNNDRDNRTEKLGGQTLNPLLNGSKNINPLTIAVPDSLPVELPYSRLPQCFAFVPCADGVAGVGDCRCLHDLFCLLGLKFVPDLYQIVKVQAGELLRKGQVGTQQYFTDVPLGNQNGGLQFMALKNLPASSFGEPVPLRSKFNGGVGNNVYS